MKLGYEYGELQANGSVDATKNAGNIARQTIGFSGLAHPFVQTYRYDSLDRITEARETVGGVQTWMQTFGYDRYGNRTSFSQDIGGIAKNTTPAVDANTNRFTSTDFGYDANGNVIGDIDEATNLPRPFIFNGDNKQTEVKRDGMTIGRYFYDGEGRRVKKVTDTETTVFVYAAGQLIAEYSPNVAPIEDAKVSYTTADHLGSPRIITDANGQVISRRDFMPFGEELYAGIGPRTGDAGLKYSSTDDDIRQKFTGYLKDSETGLDFAEARMYANELGRFTAVDPLLASGKSANPQTFNRYIYVANSPLVMIDPTGLVMDDWYIRNDGDISVRRTSDTSDRFFVYDESKGDYNLVATLAKNSAGLVEFPDSGTGFTRYPPNDLGGYDEVVGENVGAGDRFLKPEVAASLFGLTNQLSNQFGITMALGDMSSSNGSDPWSPGTRGPNNGHHEGHGHLGNRTGLDIDFRYIGNDGRSRQGNLEISLLGGRQTGSPTSSYTNGFSVEKTQAVFATAVKFGFQQNYHDVVATSRVNGSSSSVEFRGAKTKDGHRNHGHLGYVPKSIRIKTLR